MHCPQVDAACNCTQSAESYSVCLAWVHVYLLQSQHRFCGDLGKYFLSAWRGTEGCSLVIQPSSWLIDRQQFREVAVSIILTRQSDESFNCSQTPAMTHLVNIHHTPPCLFIQNLLTFQFLCLSSLHTSHAVCCSVSQWQKIILSTV